MYFSTKLQKNHQYQQIYIRVRTSISPSFTSVKPCFHLVRNAFQSLLDGLGDFCSSHICGKGNEIITNTKLFSRKSINLSFYHLSFTYITKNQSDLIVRLILYYYLV